mmetsp:Transcript_24562/g.77751  ORF Transcript_24562/g.77751 Transcript_24562/m.77751 type:complete len:111 (+) Transcript_24562:455-787(+)
MRSVHRELCTWSRVACTSFSDSLSSADVASSRMSTCGCLARARAIAMRCFWPPDIWPPPTPAQVWKPAGRALTKPKASACLAAWRQTSSEMLGSPPLIFSRMDVWKRTGS